MTHPGRWGRKKWLAPQGCSERGARTASCFILWEAHAEICAGTPHTERSAQTWNQGQCPLNKPHLVWSFLGLITLRVGGSKENQKENLPFWRVRPEKASHSLQTGKRSGEIGEMLAQLAGMTRFFFSRLNPAGQMNYGNVRSSCFWPARTCQTFHCLYECDAPRSEVFTVSSGPSVLNRQLGLVVRMLRNGN